MSLTRSPSVSFTLPHFVIREGCGVHDLARARQPTRTALAFDKFFTEDRPRSPFSKLHEYMTVPILLSTVDERENGGGDWRNSAVTAYVGR